MKLVLRLRYTILNKDLAEKPRCSPTPKNAASPKSNAAHSGIPAEIQPTIAAANMPKANSKSIETTFFLRIQLSIEQKRTKICSILIKQWIALTKQHDKTIHAQNHTLFYLSYCNPLEYAIRRFDFLHNAITHPHHIQAVRHT